MAFLAPAALALGLLAIPIVLLYMLRLRRREQPISSTLLWRQLLRDQAANAPWQRLRRNLLLLLQLLILAALVLALARPYIRVPGLATGSVVVLLDASASMQATDAGSGSTRFDAARDRVGRLITGLGGGDRMTLIRVGRTPEVLAAATNDRQSLRDALRTAAADNAAADWPAAFALAAGSVQGISDPRVVILSDGNLPGGLPALPGEVQFEAVGESGRNLAIAALSARPTEAGEELLAAVANYAPEAQEALLSLYVNDALFDSRRVGVPAGGRESLTWTLPADAGAVEARLTPVGETADYLPLDDSAWAVLEASGIRRVLLVTEGNLFLEQLLAVLPGFELVRATPDDLAAAPEADVLPYDLVVLDGVPVPDMPPGRATLVVDPQPGAETDGDTGQPPWLQVTGTFTDTVAVRIAADPLLDNVEWRDVAISEAWAVESPTLRPLIEAAAGPLLLAGEVDGRRVAVLPFDLRQSDLPLQIAFPIVMANITGWLSPARAFEDSDLQPGEPVALTPDARAETVIVEGPDGNRWEQDVQGAGGDALLFSGTEQPGIYQVTTVDSAGASQPAGRFAVNFLNADESDIQPQSALQLGGATVDAPQGGELFGRREWWPLLLLAALGLLALEWWVSYARGAGRPLIRLR